MGRRTLIALPALAFAALIASGHGCGSTPAPTQPDGGPVCAHGGAACPAGTDCVNSICTQTCSDGGACGAGAYCTAAADPQAAEAVCAPITTIACRTLFDCPSPQRCFHGVCASIEPRADGTKRFCLTGQADDKCGSDAICSQLTDPNNGQLISDCLGLPACSQNGACPPGDLGSVCNDGRQLDGGQLFSGKQRLCLPGFCTQDTDCPAQLHCFSPNRSDALGTCNNGRAGSPCFTGGDCFNSPQVSCNYPDGGVDDGGGLGTCR